MPEIPDVATLTTISIDWGNDIRDRTIQRYASAAARTTDHPTPTEGDLSYLNDANEVFVYNGSAWVAQGSLWAPVTGANANSTGSALTTTPTDKASVVFTKPAAWNTYEIVVSAVVQGAVGAGVTMQARVEIGASNGPQYGTAAFGSTTTGSIACLHSLTAQTASPVTVAVAVWESGADVTYEKSNIHFIATRLT